MISTGVGVGKKGRRNQNSIYQCTNDKQTFHSNSSLRSKPRLEIVVSEEFDERHFLPVRRESASRASTPPLIQPSRSNSSPGVDKSFAKQFSTVPQQEGGHEWIYGRFHSKLAPPR